AQDARPNHPGRSIAKRRANHGPAPQPSGRGGRGAGDAADSFDHHQQLAVCQRTWREIMPTATSTIQELANREYQAGFFTDVEMETAPRGLNEEVIRLISAKKQEPEWLLEWRLKAFRNWLTMEEPRWWPNLKIAPINYQDIIYYAAPKKKK